MSLLSPRLQLKVAQKQILTPGLVQMVTVLQLNRLELKEMITQEIVKNPVLEEATDEPGDDVTPEELLPLLEAEPVTDAADKQILEAAGLNGTTPADGASPELTINDNLFPDAEEVAAAAISARFSTIIWTPATRVRLRSPSKSHRSRRSCRPRSRSPIICARS